MRGPRPPLLVPKERLRVMICAVAGVFDTSGNGPLPLTARQPTAPDNCRWWRSAFVFAARAEYTRAVVHRLPAGWPPSLAGSSRLFTLACFSSPDSLAARAKSKAAAAEPRHGGHSHGFKHAERYPV